MYFVGRSPGSERHRLLPFVIFGVAPFPLFLFRCFPSLFPVPFPFSSAYSACPRLPRCPPWPRQSTNPPLPTPQRPPPQQHPPPPHPPRSCRIMPILSTPAPPSPSPGKAHPPRAPPCPLSIDPRSCTPQRRMP